MRKTSSAEWLKSCFLTSFWRKQLFHLPSGAKRLIATFRVRFKFQSFPWIFFFFLNSPINNAHKKNSPIESQCAVLQRLLWHKTPQRLFKACLSQVIFRSDPNLWVKFAYSTKKITQADITSSHAAAERAADSCRDIRLGPETVDPMWNTYTHPSFV